jgi:hypothetical protein
MSDTVYAIGSSTDNTIPSSDEIRNNPLKTCDSVVRVFARSNHRYERIMCGKRSSNIQNCGSIWERLEEDGIFVIINVNNLHLELFEGMFDTFDKERGIFVYNCLCFVYLKAIIKERFYVERGEKITPIS